MILVTVAAGEDCAKTAVFLLFSRQAQSPQKGRSYSRLSFLHEHVKEDPMSSQVVTGIRSFVHSWEYRVIMGARWLRFKWTLPLLGVLLLLGTNVVTSSTAVIPTISITSVVTDASVTIQTYNYPANQTFTVRMGEMGTHGVGGIVVGTLNSGAGGSMSATFNIPAELAGRSQIAIRLDSPQGFFSYNWFFNDTTQPAPVPAPAPAPGHTGIPTFSIQSVQRDQSVTIVTRNFPPNQTFTVRMGLMGTLGISGQVVDTIESGAGGQLTQTFNIPESLRGQHRISIRAQTAHTNPYFAYNWFYNAEAPAPPGTGNGTGGGTIGYTGVPTFRICTVTRDGEVTIQTHNFPANQTFRVTMGPMFSRGIGGTEVGTIESGAGGTARHTFTIPGTLHSSSRIAIRAQTGHANPFFTYNWFHNTTTTSDYCG
jgi:hypothetical protein